MAEKKQVPNSILENQTRTAFEEALEARQATYAMLQRLFASELDQVSFDSLLNMRLNAATGNEKVDNANRLLMSFMNCRWERTLLELAIDYSRVFIGAGKDAYAAAYPFESVYCGDK